MRLSVNRILCQISSGFNNHSLIRKRSTFLLLLLKKEKDGGKVLLCKSRVAHHSVYLMGQRAHWIWGQRGRGRILGKTKILKGSQFNNSNKNRL